MERERASSGEDARLVRTRDALHVALLKLIALKPFDRITIREIAAEAAVGYTTFFRPYPSKEVLLEASAEDQIRRLVALSLSAFDAENSRAGCSALCHYVGANRAYWSTLLTGAAQQTMRNELIRVSQEVAAARSSGWVPTELGVALTASSIVEILSWWLRQPERVPVEAVAEMLDVLAISPVVASAAKQG